MGDFTFFYPNKLPTNPRHFLHNKHFHGMFHAYSNIVKCAAVYLRSEIDLILYIENIQLQKYEQV